jgi:hypothetical protein
VKTAALMLIAASALLAQNPTVGEMKTFYTQIKTNLVRMAEKMPADQYDFKPVPEIRTFGALMGHIADSQLRTCSFINSGTPKQPTAGQMTKKDELVTALKESFAECDKAFDGLTDANASQMMKMGRGETSRLGILNRFVVVHGYVEYGYGSIYLRLKGIVPPSSDAPAAGGRKQ